MLLGRLGITTDVEAARQLLFNDSSRILLLSEEPIMEKSDRVIPATILLPPYTCVMAALDNNIEVACDEYINYLSSREPDMFICTVIAALKNGMNILILLGKDEAEVGFSNWLGSYLANVFGIVMATDKNGFMYNNVFDPMILAKLYMYDLITSEELFIRYPQGFDLPRGIIAKLVMELNPYVQYPSEEAYYAYFNGYKERIKQHNNQPLISPLMRGGV